MAYNYLEAIKEDIKSYLDDNISDYADYEDIEDFRDDLYDNLWGEDSVTGNTSGSYTFNREEEFTYIAFYQLGRRTNRLDIFSSLVCYMFNKGKYNESFTLEKVYKDNLIYHLFLFYLELQKLNHVLLIKSTPYSPSYCIQISPILPSDAVGSLVDTNIGR